MTRPPRTDNPTAIKVLLPGELREWLRRQAIREERDQGDVMTDALKSYRRRAERNRARRTGDKK
jgi:hypothetical protein